MFAFIFLILTLVAIGTSMQVIKQPVLLARQQTEEWKGWMQVGRGWPREHELGVGSRKGRRAMGRGASLDRSPTSA